MSYDKVFNEVACDVLGNRFGIGKFRETAEAKYGSIFHVSLASKE